MSVYRSTKTLKNGYFWSFLARNSRLFWLRLDAEIRVLGQSQVVRARDTGLSLVRRGPLPVQLEQTLQQLRIRQRRRPSVGSEDRVVQFAVGVLQPGWAFVVEVGQGQLGEGLRSDRGRFAED